MKDMLSDVVRRITRLSSPLMCFLLVEAASGLVLILATVFALVADNTSFRESYTQFWNLGSLNSQEFDTNDDDFNKDCIYLMYNEINIV